MRYTTPPAPSSVVKLHFLHDWNLLVLGGGGGGGGRAFLRSTRCNKSWQLTIQETLCKRTELSFYYSLLKVFLVLLVNSYSDQLIFILFQRLFARDNPTYAEPIRTGLIRYIIQFNFEFSSSSLCQHLLIIYYNGDVSFYYMSDKHPEQPVKFTGQLLNVCFFIMVFKVRCKSPFCWARIMDQVRFVPCVIETLFMQNVDLKQSVQGTYEHIVVKDYSAF